MADLRRRVSRLLLSQFATPPRQLFLPDADRMSPGCFALQIPERLDGRFRCCKHLVICNKNTK